MKRTFLSVALSLSCLATASAFAADGYVTGNVNLRAGPDVGYPIVDRLPAGTSVVIYGCIDGWSWCDVSTRNDRGWVAGSFLQQEYQGRRVLVPDYGVRIGIPIISFVFGTYWGDHYRGRSWYDHRDRWSHVSPSYRPIHGPVHGPIHAHPAPPPHRPSHPVAPRPGHGHPPVSAPHPAPRPTAHPAPQKPAPHGHPNDDHHDNHHNDHNDHGH
jgi:uncharacterized protein YraI